MRPIRLTLQAFGPYGDREVIDFRDALDAGLFGIYGQTGSGKSTIFSAMTFALFGESAKTEQESSSLRSDHADPDVPTEVELVFDIGARRFVIVRQPEQMRPKHRGTGETRSPHEAFLFDATDLALDEIMDGQRGKILAEKKVGLVGAAVTELLGYGPEQFRQIVLLPQGRFETFLSAKTRERLEILRDLFDVSLFRNLVARLKADAETAEQEVREEREVCARRLSAEGFESTDALIAGIGEAEARYTELTETEEQCRAAATASQGALADAKEMENRFRAAEAAQQSFMDLQRKSLEIDALVVRIQKAQSAKALLDPEGRVVDAAQEVVEAEKSCKVARSAALGAADRAKVAAADNEAQTARAGELDALRREIETLGRHAETLGKGLNIRSAVNEAREIEASARTTLNNTEQILSTLMLQRQEQADGLKSAQRNENHRRDLTKRQTALQAALGGAEEYEKSAQNLKKSTDEVARLQTEHDASLLRLQQARIAGEEAERQLSDAQALHLATKLQAGAPCPVCGSLDHPAPRMGSAEHAGLDKAFREAKEACEREDKDAREIERKLTSAQGVFLERTGRLDALERPLRCAAAIAEDITATQKTLDKLGPEFDLAAAEGRAEKLVKVIENAEGVRDRHRLALVDAEKETAIHTTRLDEILSGVPESLRNRAKIAATLTAQKENLSRREAERDAASTAAKETREASIAAQKDLQAEEKVLAVSKERFGKASQVFQIRLKEVGLKEESFIVLKPSIDEIESDQEMVNEHNRKIANAKDEVKKTKTAISDQDRPDVQSFEEAVGKFEENLSDATGLRASAKARLDHLHGLHEELVETFRRLDEIEETTGPLRHLALLTDGKNQQKLDLETFAVGAMFDQVLEAANQRLGPMYKHRYRLEREIEGSGQGRRGLGIQVFDIYSGKSRPTSTLSGGETFIAALALALGLADVVESVSGKVQLDTIFIDEGFGSLDTENGSGTLEQVLHVLSSLVSQNRAVGLISHVALVQEAIPNGFYAVKEVSGSRVETRGFI